MTKKKNKSRNYIRSIKKDQKCLTINKANNDISDDLIIGNIPNLNENKKKKNLPKIVQIKKNFKKIKKEKELLSNLDTEQKEKAEHLLKVKKAILKSKGEKVYDEKSLKKRKKNIFKRKEKSRKRWENKTKKL
ncbi:conserved Plasmodium protein, unknown function [Plasmodium gallinaceum]|uniref:Ribosomal RNA-processing protein 14/surfeit locus protein 6 C-terminal domain-containing protein n=1 Tax=Plasmodium gallinaceum TaxID=5849 RepID=A0A1J1GX53_PLAGA|nr:conserved Plasmodium protein, unknown function [Plasmodium gallinaceum]CRG96832.1 conserved Plasmodium protein, unknown function [Plasmodium gallinaceum]